ncbi:hypothetical protein INT47_011350 [Mucor saturninus]|uniref:Tc1-like transposase DDE domain-containing protein n=1 Tax=Mucor saturninus TaxID=64648 RepID=A0A8H7V7P0_9FUNG|nr:hypothetical protein INT47_011350 [Mucor saturninus]
MTLLNIWHTEGRVEKKKRGGRRRELVKFEDAHGEYITKLFDEDCTQTLDTIKERLEAEFPDLAAKKISTSGLWRYITGCIGFTLKRTKAVEERRNTPATIEQRFDYIVHRLPERGIAYKTNCIFVDEAGFNANLICGQGYFEERLNKCCISYHGVEDVSVKIVKGGTTGDIFREFVRGIMKKLDDTNAGPHFFVMDNASIHKTPAVKELLKNSNHQMCLLPPYSPFLNPIEECFSKLKTLVKRKPNLKGKEELVEHIRQTIHQISEENCQGWIDHSIQFFGDCTERKEIF